MLVISSFFFIPPGPRGVLVYNNEFLSTEEKTVVANSKLEFVKAKSLKLRKDMIVAMDKTNKVNEKIKELIEALHVEKMLVVQKDEEIQVALLRTNVEKDKVVQKFMQLE